MSKWIDNYIKKIKEIRTDAALKQIIKDIYNEGVEDTCTEPDDSSPEPMPWEDLD